MDTQTDTQIYRRTEGRTVGARQREREKDNQLVRWIDSEIETLVNKNIDTDGQIGRQTARCIGGWTDRQIDRQIDRQTDGQTDRQIDRQIDYRQIIDRLYIDYRQIIDRLQIDRQINRQINRQIDRITKDKIG